MAKYLTNAGFEVKYVKDKVSQGNLEYIRNNSDVVAFETHRCASQSYINR